MGTVQSGLSDHTECSVFHNLDLVTVRVFLFERHEWPRDLGKAVLVDSKLLRGGQADV
jgi:hypothetical protein